MNNFIQKHSDKINGYLLITPAVLIISLFGVFPVFFGMYMSVHKWKVFKGTRCARNWQPQNAAALFVSAVEGRPCPLNKALGSGHFGITYLV